jgi:hypothetical protein
MRIKSSLLLLLSLTVTWSACENAPDPDDQTPLGPVFAKGGPECDTKAAPVREYFLDKTTEQEVSELFRALATSCADLDGSTTLDVGFTILAKVEFTRETPFADGLKGDAADGALVAFTTLSIMNYVCEMSSDCFPGTSVLVGDLIGALSDGGAFSVVSGPGTDPVFTYGSSPYWFVEPFGSSNWGGVIPGGSGLVLGTPTDAANPLPAETALNQGGSFSLDWKIVYFATGALSPVSVTMCESAAGDLKKEKIAHRGALLQEGNADASDHCYDILDPTLAVGFATRLGRLAAAVVPLWPQPLLAGFTGGSASGKATEFSPFFGYEIDPVGLVEFITVPLDTNVGQPICAAAGASGGSCPENGGIRVHLTTSNRSLLSGDETVIIRITAEDNNGSWTLYGDVEGQKVSVEGYGLVYEWIDLNLDKPGAYKLHTYYTDSEGYVYLDDGSHLLDADGNWVKGWNTVGIDFPAASSEKFIVNP